MIGLGLKGLGAMPADALADFIVLGEVLFQSVILSHEACRSGAAGVARAVYPMGLEYLQQTLLGRRLVEIR